MAGAAGVAENRGLRRGAAVAVAAGMTTRRVALLVSSVLAGCTSHTLEAPTVVPAPTIYNGQTLHQNNKLDLLFMIDDSNSMESMQQKLQQQLPVFMHTLQNSPSGLPDIHIAVVSSDLGAPSDVQNLIGCTRLGDQGIFRAQPEGTCTATTLTAGANFLSDSNGIANFTDPIDQVFQCVALLGANGCGFEHQLASIDRALGADGQGPPPSQNTGFLRDDAILAIVLLTNEDDCSAPPDTTLYSENGGQENLSNPLGPLGGGFRCNRYGHLCTDPATGATGLPPLTPPSDASGTPPMLQLNKCTSNDTSSGMLIPVSKFINDIRALKVDPDNQILVAAIAAPAAPYGVVWTTEKDHPTEAFPEVMHSCGTGPFGVTNPSAAPTSDGSFGDPGVRIQQFLNGFTGSVFSSVCDPSYAGAMINIAKTINQKFAPPCFTGQIAKTADGTPDCSVIDRALDGAGSSQALPNCDQNGNHAPCWSLVTGDQSCSGQLLNVTTSGTGGGAIDRSIECSICVPGVSRPGCE